MKRWLVFILGVAATGTVLFLAIQKNLQIVDFKKQVKLNPVGSAVQTQIVTERAQSLEAQKPVGVIALATPSSAKVSSTEGEISSPQKVENSKPVSQAKEPSFLETTFRIMQFYRAGNQKFLKEAVQTAQTNFSRAYEQASKLKASSDREAKVKQCLKDAALTRLESIRFYVKIHHAQASDRVETWWEQNIDLLKKANDDITRAVRLTSELIREQSESLGTDRNATGMLQNLQENAKGILVVAKSAQS